MTIPTRTFTAEEILTGNRNTRFFVDVLDMEDSFVVRLDGVTSGELNWIANAAVKGAGKLRVVDVSQDIDWLTARIRPTMAIDGLDEQQLGVFLPAEAPESWGSGRNWDIQMLDKTTIPNQDKIDETFSLAAGAVITTEVIALIVSTGETRYAVTPSAKTLDGPLTWEAGTPKLSIINDLLHVAGYFAMWADYSGQFRVEPYVFPADRPIRFEFVDGPNSIYSPDFVKDVDLQIPNKFVAIGQGDSATEALSAVATNTDVLSPYSFPNRGRWITETETGIEAADQIVLDNYALRRLIEMTSKTSSIDVSHAPIPGLAVNDAVRLQRVPAGVDARHVVNQMTISLDGTSLAKSTLMEVVDL